MGLPGRKPAVVLLTAQAVALASHKNSPSKQVPIPFEL